jgi:hypothetical protein
LQFIEGAWRVDVTPRPCDTAGNPIDGPGGSSFPTLNTYHRGGTLSEHGSRLSPARRGSGHGIWRRTGYSRFEYRLEFQIFDTNGFLTHTQTISTELVMDDADTLTGKSRFKLTDLSGNSTPLQCATIVGTRIDF